MKSKFRLGLWIGCMLLLLLVGCKRGTGTDVTPTPLPTPPEPEQETIAAVLYFSDSMGQHVIPERRSVTVTQSAVAQAVLREWLKGPEDPHLVSVAPPGVEVLGANLENGRLTVDLSAEVLEVSGSTGELLFLRGLTYTLTDIEGIESVQLLIDGERHETLAGHITIEATLTRGPLLRGPIFFDEERAAWLQDRVDQGIEEFRQDPLEVVAFEGRMIGLTGNESLEFLYQDKAYGMATVLVSRDEETLAFHLIQPERVGDEGIWIIQSVGDYGVDSGRFNGQVDSNSIEVQVTGVPEEVGPQVYGLSFEAQESLQELNLKEGDLIRFHFTAEEGQRPVIERLERMES